MQTIQGKYTEAIVLANNVEQACLDQIQALTDNPEFKDAVIRIMPDCHAGKGCTVGTTILTQSHNFSPELVGVDIGCGVRAMIFSQDLAKDKLTPENLSKNDAKVRELIGGKVSRINISRSEVEQMVSSLKCLGDKDPAYIVQQCGSLGSGNHFLEIDCSEDSSKYAIIVHTGSRYLGQLVCNYYVEKYHNGDSNWFEDYLHDMLIAQQYACCNRSMILRTVAELFELPSDAQHNTGDPYWIESVHNYIEYTIDGFMIRKGAIRAYGGEPVIVPFNMHYGTLIGEGTCDPYWNFSLPHGAGRTMSRSDAKHALDLSKFEDDMQGIITSSVSAKTLDEAPDAYKKPDEILDIVQWQIRSKELFKPLYIFKS